MAKCRGCGKKGFFLRLQDGLCESCYRAQDHARIVQEMNSLERTYKQKLDRHFALSQKMQKAYRAAKRDNIPMDKVIAICEEDIALAEDLYKYWTRHRQLGIQAGYWTAQTNKGVPQYPSFTYLAAIYEDTKNYDKALDICKRAISIGFTGDHVFDNIHDRIERIETSR